MAKNVVGIFDDYKQAGNAVSRLIDKNLKENISIIGKEVSEMETIEAFNDNEELGDVITEPYIGNISGSLGHLVPGFVLMKTNQNNIFTSGRLSDILSASDTFKNYNPGNLQKALINIGFNKNKSHYYSNLIEDGRVLIFVDHNKNTNQDIRNIFQEMGALEIDSVNNDLLD